MADANTGSCFKDSFHVVVTALLPVTLTSYSATLSDNKVLLDWVTEQEISNNFFTVEKSTDGNKYALLQKVPAAGNSSLPKSYRVTDFAPSEGVNYYRLSQVNIDGRITYLGTRSIIYKSSKSFNAGIINSATEEVTLLVNTNRSTNVSVRITDITGRKIIDENIPAAAGTTTKKIHLNRGLYVLTAATANGEKVSNKIVVR